MVEPMEETRNELVFATEPVLSSLELAIPGAGRFASIVELDEVEVRSYTLLFGHGFTLYYNADPERDLANMQRVILPSHICKAFSFQYLT